MPLEAGTFSNTKAEKTLIKILNEGDLRANKIDDIYWNKVKRFVTTVLGSRIKNMNNLIKINDPYIKKLYFDDMEKKLSAPEIWDKFHFDGKGLTIPTAKIISCLMLNILKTHYKIRKKVRDENG